jgi:hypothetical protein
MVYFGANDVMWGDPEKEKKEEKKKSTSGNKQEEPKDRYDDRCRKG